MQASFLVSSTPLVSSPADPAGRRALWVRKGARRRACVVASASGGESKVMKMLSKECFAKISRNTETSSVGTPPLPVSPPPSSFGSPLFWIGVGVGISALFSWAANRAKNYAIQQAFKTMGSMAQEKGSFATSGMFPGTTFPSNIQASSFRMPPPPPPPPAVSKSTAPVDATDAKVAPPPPTNTEEDVLSNEEPKKYSFVDVSPEDVSQTGSSEGFRYTNEVVQPNGSAVEQDKSEAYEQSQSQKSPVMSVEALEKMMEDPTVQKMVYPYLPEEMRNPTTFKWMMQNPQYRAQLQEMLNNMGGSAEWDNQVMNSLKNFDLSSPEVKQQFDQIGLSPEEVISKIMENPDVAMSFQNPKVQAAIMDCSQNPLNIRKYQDDKEVMDVFNKISELFPGVSGSF